jgi:PKD repeat protein
MFPLFIFSQTVEEKRQIVKDYNIKELNELAGELKGKLEKEKKEAELLAVQNGWPVRYEENGVLYELMKMTDKGAPLYYQTYNANASISTRAKTLNSGGLMGLNLDGQNMEAHVWDGGLARATHQEYDGPGGSNRFSIGDGTSALHYHSAHVTGTIIAYGAQAAAKGMAPHASAVGYEWTNDVSEATTAAANGMLLSNHSYGWNIAHPSFDPWRFGAYASDSRDWDVVMNAAPYYLMIVAAGNEGDDNNSNTVPLDGNNYYDKLAGHSTTKNNLVVANAQDANIDANGNLVSVSINSSSSEGPCDDYRIKPDITGNGTSVYSTFEGSDTDYASITGTSMASPNVCGTLVLLQQHYNNLNGGFMRAATLKGLALHTADDAGSVGPDAIFGWGLLNAKQAASSISTNGSESIISELTLNNGASFSFDVESDGLNDLVASISWNDPAGTANSGTANLTTPVLVNDLDIRVTQGGSTYYPYKLTSITTNTTGDNIVDPYEKVIISGASGTYTITVTHKGSLTGSSQDYSLIVTGQAGIPSAPVANFNADDLSPSVGQTVNFTDVSLNNPTFWSWSFSPATVTYVEGTSSTDQHPKVTFDAPGNYAVTLDVSNAQGNDTEIKSNYITASYSISATYSSGDIPTDYSFQSLPGSSSCPGSLTVGIPIAATINSIDVEYDMSSQSNGWLSEQRSELRCTSTGGAHENILYSGTGNSTGTQSYSRTGLTIANGVVGGGDIDFELHAGRSWGGSGCNTTYNKVDNNTWTITVYYTPGTPTPPSCTTPVKPADGAVIVPISTNLEWNSAGGATGYYLFFGTDNPPTNLVNGASQTNTTFKPSGNLSLNTTYYWKVVPYNSYGPAAGCNIWTFTTTANPCETIEIDILTDNYGYETSWELVDDATSSVLLSGGQGGVYANNTNYSQTICLDRGCYTFTIYDSYGDGICCSYGNGYYSVSNLTTTQVYGTGGSFGSSESVSFCITIPGLWTGNTSSDWAIATNWDDDNTPSSSTNVTIPSSPEGGNFPETNSGSGAECNDLLIALGAHLFIPADNTLSVNGTLINNAGTNGLFVQSNNFGTGSLMHNTDNIGASVKRHFTEDEWHYVSSPISDAMSYVFLDMYLKPFVESSYSWGDYIVGNIPLEVMKGYALWTYDEGTVSFDGQLNNGPQSINVTANYPGPENIGFNLVGNPFPSAVDWDLPGWDKSHVDNTIYFWSGVGGTGGAGNYYYYVGSGGELLGVGTQTTNSIIPVGQGFFVRATENGSLGINNNTRVHDGQAYYKEDKENNLPLIRLKTETSESTLDETVIRFYPDATAEFDGDFDAYKLDGYLVPQIYSITPANSALSINTHPTYENGTIIPLGFVAPTEGEYTLSLSEFENFEMGTELILEDLQENTFHSLSLNPEYLFNGTPDDNAERFNLHFANIVGLEKATEDPIQIYSFGSNIYIQKPKNFNGEIYVCDILGHEIITTKSAGEGILKLPIRSGTGYYIVKVHSNSLLKTEKVFIK